jgi:iron complex outermembrane recepter protein
MLNKIALAAVALYMGQIGYSQDQKVEQTGAKDTIRTISLDQVTITTSKIPVKFIQSTSASSVALSRDFETMQRSIAADEALKFIPGVRIDNQANGSRLHMSIRGQGILSERGLRGIRVMIDGLPVNDPSGFAPDLYDVDWHTMERIEVLRGSSASVYGGSSSAGVLNIITKNGGNKPFGGEFYSSFGSNGFYKVLGQANGSNEHVDYRVSLSHFTGNGYRDHTGFWGDNFSEKLCWKPSDKLTLQQVILVTGYFNQNAEGLSIGQVEENPLQANPDAIPFNEYQKTNRYTSGLTGHYEVNSNGDIDFYAFMRWSRYKETSNKAAQYRNFETPGGMLQYNLHLGNDRIKNTLSIGTDYQSQSIAEVKFKSLSDTLRVDKLDEKNLEDSVLLANQAIDQQSAGVYLIDQLQIGERLTVFGSLRYDYLGNKLNDKLNLQYNTSGSKNFDRVTGKAGVSYKVVEAFIIYGNYAQGFIPPATEELASNPDAFSGFNENLVPATSSSIEAGARGKAGNSFYYDVCGFILNTQDDFFRFKLTQTRGNQEVFYGNAGDSKRFGMESFVSWNPFSALSLQAAYTFSHFEYTSPDSLKGIALPNSPQHQFACDAEYKVVRNLKAGITYEMQSAWNIYTDAVHKDLEQDGFSLISARVSYEITLKGVNGELAFFAKNITNQDYIAFTEPDPDGNCYQPGSGREFFGQLNIRF